MIDYNFSDLLGIPYKLGGRDKKGFDCYGFVIFYEARFDNFLVDYKSPYPKENNEQFFNENILNILNCSKLIKTSMPKHKDVILFYDRKGRANHIAVYLKNDDFIHCDSSGVRVSNLKNEKRRWSVFTWPE